MDNETWMSPPHCSLLLIAAAEYRPASAVHLRMNSVLTTLQDIEQILTFLIPVD